MVTQNGYELNDVFIISHTGPALFSVVSKAQGGKVNTETACLNGTKPGAYIHILRTCETYINLLIKCTA